MTIRYEYKCNKCLHEYAEQRGNDELEPIFSICHFCKEGVYEETSKEILSLETERNPGPEIIIDEIDIQEPLIEEPTE